MSLLDRRSVLLLSGGALAAVAAGVAAANRTGPDAGGRTGADRPWLTGLSRTPAAGSVLTLSGPDGTQVLTRDGRGWTIADLDGYPAAEPRVAAVLADLAGLTVDAPRTADPGLHGLLGLADPRAGGPAEAMATAVTLTGPGGRTVSALIGAPVPAAFGTGVYGRRPGEDRTYRLSGRLALPRHPLDWIDRRLIDRPPESVAALTIHPPGGGRPLRIERRDGRFVIPDLPPDRRVAEPFRLSNTASWLERLEITGIRRDPLTGPGEDPRRPDAVFVLDGGLRVEAWRVDGRPADPDDLGWVRLRFHGPGAGPLTGRTDGYVFRFPRHKLERLRYTIADATDPDPG